jgi:DNA modification methylase
MKKFGHPAMFPEELPRRLIKMFSYKGDIVLDPFSGCGTTLKVAKDLGRQFIGFEIDDKYIQIAIDRIKGK